MKWDRPQKEGVFRGKVAEGALKSKLYLSQYRPFFKQHLYFDRFWNNCVYQMPALFPMNNTKGTSSRKRFDNKFDSFAESEQPLSRVDFCLSDSIIL